jgi:hypothetical protein
VIPLRRRELPNVRELSSIFHPVISATVFPRLESSIQSGVAPLELIASVIRIRTWAWVDATLARRAAVRMGRIVLFISFDFLLILLVLVYFWVEVFLNALNKHHPPKNS